MSYNKILENNHDKTVDVKNMLSEIVELFPANVWTENNTSLYVRIIRECVSLCDEIKSQKSSQGTMLAEAAVLKIVRNWMSHQGIKNIMAYDVAFIFYLLMVAFFSYDVDDNTEDYNYMEDARQLILEFDNRQSIVAYHFDEQINRIENIVRNRHKEAYERFKIKVGPEKTKQLQKNYFYSDGASVYETISAMAGLNMSCFLQRKSVLSASYHYNKELPLWKLITSILDRIVIEVYYMSERINQYKNPLVGSNIKRLRKEQNMKAVDVIAKLQLMGLSVTTRTFSKVENGYNNPSVDLLICLTKIFHSDFNAFFSPKCIHFCYCLIKRLLPMPQSCGGVLLRAHQKYIYE